MKKTHSQCSDPAPAGAVLLTGFEPFGGDTLNVSWEVARALDGARVESARVQAVQLPCEFESAPQALAAALRRWRPVAVVCLGQAAGRSELSIERVAVNLVDAAMPDNAGQQPVDVPVVAGGPAAYFTRLPAKAWRQAMAAQGLGPVGLSHTAGTYVCNQVFYELLHRLRRRPGVPAGFVHLPLLPEQLRGPADTRPCLPLPRQVATMQAMLQCLWAMGPAPAEPGGALS